MGRPFACEDFPAIAQRLRELEAGQPRLTGAVCFACMGRGWVPSVPTGSTYFGRQHLPCGFCGNPKNQPPP